MLDKLWLFMMLGGLAFAMVTGNFSAVSSAVVEGGGEAVTVVLSMAGALAVWSGLMEVARGAGLLKALERGLRPVLRFLFPELNENHPALPHIALNFAANILGLGWAATPAGLKAMEELQKGRRERGRASRAMCTFLIINMSSVQLINMNVLAWRAQYGSADPAAAVLPSLAATGLTTLTAVFLCRLLGRGRE